MQGEVIDETAIKRIILNFEKRCLKNREMRIKFPDAAEKFMESEVELHEILQEMRVLATAPDYYSLLVKLNVIPSLLELLAHDNTDIAVCIYVLFYVIYFAFLLLPVIVTGFYKVLRFIYGGLFNILDFNGNCITIVLITLHRLVF